MKFFHCYATANEDRSYKQDIVNLVNIARSSTGVEKVYLIIAIGQVKERCWNCEKFSNFARKLFEDHSQYELISIVFKENLGRDFSSYDLMNTAVQGLADPDDFVFFQNRSAYGPYLDNWYKTFVDCYQRDDAVTLVGCTINFQDHHSRSERQNLPHIQTYAFLSTAKHFSSLLGNFPGKDEIDRLRIITEGEIGLSQYFLHSGGKLSCLEWPGLSFDVDDKPPIVGDVKRNVTKALPFYHRRFFKRNNTSIKNNKWRAMAVYCKFLLSF